MCRPIGVDVDSAKPANIGGRESDLSDGNDGRWIQLRGAIDMSGIDSICTRCAVCKKINQLVDRK